MKRSPLERSRVAIVGILLTVLLVLPQFGCDGDNPGPGPGPVTTVIDPTGTWAFTFTRDNDASGCPEDLGEPLGESGMAFDLSADQSQLDITYDGWEEDCTEDTGSYANNKVTYTRTVQESELGCTLVIEYTMEITFSSATTATGTLTSEWSVIGPAACAALFPDLPCTLIYDMSGAKCDGNDCYPAVCGDPPDPTGNPSGTWAFTRTLDPAASTCPDVLLEPGPVAMDVLFALVGSDLNMAAEDASLGCYPAQLDYADDHAEGTVEFNELPLPIDVPNVGEITCTVSGDVLFELDFVGEDATGTMTLTLGFSGGLGNACALVPECVVVYDLVGEKCALLDCLPDNCELPKRASTTRSTGWENLRARFGE